jgi:hypothetical protein
VEGELARQRLLRGGVLTVMSLLELDRRDVAQGAVQPVVVEPVGPGQRPQLEVVMHWSLIALFVAPLMALLGVFARKPNRWSLIAGLAAPILISYITLGSPTGAYHIRPWSQWLMLCAAVGLALAFVRRAARLDHRRPALLESPSGRV